jgi:hypothetical protein
MGERLTKFRQRVFDEIRKVLEKEGHHKWYEGQISHNACYPNYFHKNAPESHTLELDCYLLGPERHYKWTGTSLDECLDQAEGDLDEWIEEQKNEQDD